MSSFTSIPKQAKVYRVRSYDQDNERVGTDYYLFIKDVESFKRACGGVKVTEKMVDVSSSKYKKAVKASKARNVGVFDAFNHWPRFKYIEEIDNVKARAHRWLDRKFVELEISRTDLMRYDEKSAKDFQYAVLELIKECEEGWTEMLSDKNQPASISKSNKMANLVKMKDVFLSELVQYHQECQIKNPREYVGFLAIKDADQIKDVEAARRIHFKNFV